MPDFDSAMRRQGLEPRAPSALQAELDALLEQNRAGFAELDRLGAGINPVDLINLRIFTLAELVLAGPGLVQFQLRYERKLAEILEQVRGEARKARMAASPLQVQQVQQAVSGLLGPNGQPIR